jgi:hypothetical protein
MKANSVAKFEQVDDSLGDKKVCFCLLNLLFISHGTFVIPKAKNKTVCLKTITEDPRKMK